MVAWAPAYVVYWGWRNFLAICDVAVVLTAIGLWRGSPLLVSSQALPTFVVGGMWAADVGARLTTGRHLLGGTEYMWDARVPLPVRLLSLFHVALPIVQIVALRRLRYDPKALPLQTALTAVLLVAARFVGEQKNLNFAFRDPLLGRTWGPGGTHLLVILAGAVLLVYLPTHLAFRRWLGRRPASG